MERVLLRDEVGRDDGATGLSDGKKPDIRLRGDGEGGIWERVSIVLSDKDGLGRRVTVRDLAGGSSLISSISPAIGVSTGCAPVAACCIESLVPLSVSTGTVEFVAFCLSFSGRARLLGAYLVESNGDTFTAVRGRGSLESLGIPDAWRFL